MATPEPPTTCHLQRPDGVQLRWFRHPPSGGPGHPPPGAASRRPPVLLLHGLASNASRFAEFCELSALRRHHVLLRPDLRGHGGSLTRRRIDSETWCDDLAAILAAEASAAPAAGHGAAAATAAAGTADTSGAAQATGFTRAPAATPPGPRAFVVGHSLGAQVALHLAARHPALVQGLVLIDPVFRHTLHGQPRRIAQAAPLLRAAATLVRAANALGLHRRSPLPPLDLRVLDGQARAALASPDPAAVAAFVAQYSSTRADLRHVPLAVYLQDLVEMFRAVPPPGRLGLPVLALLSGGATFADTQAMGAALAGPQVQLQVLPCEHWPLTERPAEVRQAVDAWVAERAAEGVCEGAPPR